MSNKRVSQLVEMGASEVSGSDFFYIVDVSAGEGKKIQASVLSAYLASSGSLNAIHAESSDTASYILGSNVAGQVPSSSFATDAISAKSASYASSSISSSYALTSSYSLNATAGSTVSSSWSSQSFSSSFATNALAATNAFSAAFLIYTGVVNGTASYAMKAKLAETTLLAETASYISGIGPTVSTASYAIESGHAYTATGADTASFLNYNGNYNGTASYAMLAGGFSSNTYSDYGVFLATTQSISSSQLDLVQISASNGNSASTQLEVWGTVIVPYTSSIPVDETLTFIVFNRNNGTSASIDSTPIFINMSKMVATWGAEVTGTVKIPYSLIGSSSLYGDYLVYVTGSSSKIQIDTTRINRFNISSKSDVVYANTYEPPTFNVTPTSSLFTFTSSIGGPYYDYRPGILATGSNNIYVLDCINKGITSLRYVWSLTGLTTLKCGDNFGLTRLTGMPNTLQTMSCYSCSIYQIDSLQNTTMSYLDCSNNNLSSLPALPTSMSYLNCSNNNLTAISQLPNTMSYLNGSNNSITSIPSSFPFGLTQLYLNNNSIVGMTSTLPNSITTMSFASNPSLVSWTSTLPTALKRLDVSYTILTSLTAIPSNTTYVNGISSSFTQMAMTNILSQSYSNAVTNNTTGSILLNGNGYVSISSENDYVLPLQSFGWTIGYDGAA